MSKEKMRALIVDDEQVIRSFFKRLLSLMEFDVVEAQDGFKAVEIIKNESVDIAFIDVRMPGMNGLETFRKLKEIKPGIVAVMMTGYAVDDLLDEAMKEGAKGIVRKPFDINEIKNLIECVEKKKVDGGLRVLVVDDEELVHDFFSRFLKEKGLSCKFAKNKLEAVACAKKEKFGLVFLDLMLGGDSGVEVYKEIKTILPECDIVIITGHPQKAKEIEEKIQVSGCLYKPFDIDSLIKIIEKSKLEERDGDI